VRERAGEPACGQAASSGQKATRNSAEQIEKERLLGHISALKSQAVPLLLSALLGCYAGSCHRSSWQVAIPPFLTTLPASTPDA
jgi:hypothetical protein